MELLLCENMNRAQSQHHSNEDTSFHEIEEDIDDDDDVNHQIHSQLENLQERPIRAKPIKSLGDDFVWHTVTDTGQTQNQIQNSNLNVNNRSESESDSQKKPFLPKPINSKQQSPINNMQIIQGQNQSQQLESESAPKESESFVWFFSMRKMFKICLVFNVIIVIVILGYWYQLNNQKVPAAAATVIKDVNDNHNDTSQGVNHNQKHDVKQSQNLSRENKSFQKQIKLNDQQRLSPIDIGTSNPFKSQSDLLNPLNNSTISSDAPEKMITKKSFHKLIKPSKLDEAQSFINIDDKLQDQQMQTKKTKLGLETSTQTKTQQQQKQTYQIQQNQFKQSQFQTLSVSVQQTQGDADSRGCCNCLTRSSSATSGDRATGEKNSSSSSSVGGPGSGQAQGTKDKGSKGKKNKKKNKDIPPTIDGRQEFQKMTSQQIGEPKAHPTKPMKFGSIDGVPSSVKHPFDYLQYFNTANDQDSTSEKNHLIFERFLGSICEPFIDHLKQYQDDDYGLRVQDQIPLAFQQPGSVGKTNSNSNTNYYQNPGAGPKTAAGATSNSLPSSGQKSSPKSASSGSGKSLNSRKRVSFKKLKSSMSTSSHSVAISSSDSSDSSLASAGSDSESDSNAVSSSSDSESNSDSDSTSAQSVLELEVNELQFKQQLPSQPKPEPVAQVQQQDQNLPPETDIAVDQLFDPAIVDPNFKDVDTENLVLPGEPGGIVESFDTVQVPPNQQQNLDDFNLMSDINQDNIGGSGGGGGGVPTGPPREPSYSLDPHDDPKYEGKCPSGPQGVEKNSQDKDRSGKCSKGLRSWPYPNEIYKQRKWGIGDEFLGYGSSQSNPNGNAIDVKHWKEMLRIGQRAQIVGEQKNNNSKLYVGGYTMGLRKMELQSNEESDDEVIIIGDLHGSLGDVCGILLRVWVKSVNSDGVPGVNPGYYPFNQKKPGKSNFGGSKQKRPRLVFTGDYVDRMMYNMEVTLIISMLFILDHNSYRNTFMMGNHETKTFRAQLAPGNAFFEMMLRVPRDPSIYSTYHDQFDIFRAVFSHLDTGLVIYEKGKTLPKTPHIYCGHAMYPFSYYQLPRDQNNSLQDWLPKDTSEYPPALLNVVNLSQQLSKLEKKGVMFENLNRMNKDPSGSGDKRAMWRRVQAPGNKRKGIGFPPDGKIPPMSNPLYEMDEGNEFRLSFTAIWSDIIPQQSPQNSQGAPIPAKVDPTSGRFRVHYDTIPLYKNPFLKNHLKGWQQYKSNTDTNEQDYPIAIFRGHQPEPELYEGGHWPGFHSYIQANIANPYGRLSTVHSVSNFGSEVKDNANYRTNAAYVRLSLSSSSGSSWNGENGKIRPSNESGGYLGKLGKRDNIEMDFRESQVRNILSQYKFDMRVEYVWPESGRNIEM